MTEPELFTPDDLATMFQMSAWAVLDKCKSSNPWPHRRLGQRTIRFTPEDVQAIIDHAKPKPARKTGRQALKDQLKGAA